MKYIIGFHRGGARACLAFAISLALSVVLHAPAAFAESTLPADPQPETSALKPGLAVDYYYVQVRSLDEF